MKKPLRLIVLISGNGSNLQVIIDAIKNKTLPAEICAVISDRSAAFGLQRAAQANIPTHIITKQEFPQRADYDQALQQLIDNYQPDLIVLAGFMRILGAEFVTHFQARILNIHPSLLPKYPGLDTHTRVLAAGDKSHGVSIHLVTAELDSGPIIAQAELKVLANDSAETLKQRIHQLEHYLYPEVLSWFANGKLQLSTHEILFEGKPIPATGVAIKDM